MKETNWVNPEDLEHRVDAEFYKAEFIALAESLDRTGVSVPLESIWAEKNRIYIGIAGFEAIDDPAAYTPYLRPVDISKEGHIDYENLPWCERHWFDEYGDTGCAKEGDLIIEVKGNTKKAGVVTSRIPSNCIVSGSAYRIQLTEQVDTHFVQAYFLSDSGQLLKRRYCSNTTINYLDPDSFRSLSVPLPKFELQQAIGNKVRKAERLRELAQASRREVDSVFHSAVPSYPSTPEVVAWVDTSTLTDRMDPQPYRTHALALLDVIRSIPHGVLGKECQVAGGCAVPSEEFLEDGIPLIRIRDIGDRSFKPSETFVARDYYSDNSRYAASESEIVVGMDGNFRALFFLESDLPALINQRVAIIRADGVRPEFLASWLNRPEGQIQLYRTSVKTTVEHITLMDIRNVLFPRLGEGEEDRVSDLIRASREFTTESSQFVEKAKQDVEVLIKGTLEEARLLEESAEIEQWLKNNPSPSN